MNKSLTCYFNGDFLKYENLNIHVSDLLFQRGYGVFDFFRCRNGSLFWMEDYLDRFFRSKEISGIELNLDRKEIISVIHSLQEKNSFANGAFKLILSGGESDNLEAVTGPANFLILNIPWNRPSEEFFEKGVNLISDNFVRPNPEAKTLYYFNSMRLQKKMKEYAAADVMYFSTSVFEASRANLFFVKGGRISTPASGILHGITRKQILAMVPEIHVEDIPAECRYDYDEIFLASTTREITPVIMVDGKKIGSGFRGPVTRDIQTMLWDSWNK